MDNDDEVSLCLKLDKINETIQDLIKIHESLEAGDKAAEKNKSKVRISKPKGI